MEKHRMQRVKVYRLNSDGLWDDKGTGHVSVEYLEVRPVLPCSSHHPACKEAATALKTSCMPSYLLEARMRSFGRPARASK